jgi:hypothetical protein
MAKKSDREKKWPCPKGCGGKFKTKPAAAAHAVHCKYQPPVESPPPPGADTEPLELSGSEKSLAKKEADMLEDKKQEDSNLAKAIEVGFKSMDERLGKVESDVSDFCQRFPDLCSRVDGIETAISSSKIESGSEEWRKARKRDLEHTLFDECPECSPIRDEVLQSRGKKLADIETLADEEMDKLEAEVDQAEERAEAEVQADDLETSPYPRSGFKWDDEKELYVRQA